MSDLPEFWRGYLAGTDRGRVLACLRETAGTLRADVLLFNPFLGAGVVSAIGTVEGRQASLRLVDVRSRAPMNALDGRIELDFASDFSSATGTWESDLGGRGRVDLQRAAARRWVWTLRRGLLSVGVTLRRMLPVVYLPLLLALGLLAATGAVTISVPVLVLLLLPVPFLHGDSLVSLVQRIRLKRAGPFEFEQDRVPPELVVAVAQHVDNVLQRATAFIGLDFALVPRTKLLLAWLASRGGIATLEELREQALVVGVPSDNFEATLTALLMTGCAVQAPDGRVGISQFGQEYLLHLAPRLPARSPLGQSGQ